MRVCADDRDDALSGAISTAIRGTQVTGTVGFPDGPTREDQSLQRAWDFSPVGSDNAGIYQQLRFRQGQSTSERNAPRIYQKRGVANVCAGPRHPKESFWAEPFPHRNRPDCRTLLSYFRDSVASRGCLTFRNRRLGTVIDPGSRHRPGAAVPNATMSATLDATGAVRTVKTGGLP